MMAEKKMKLNKQQELAVNTLGRDVLVTASAGTGKTEVLSQRCMKIVADGQADVSNILVLTFTEAAADEMRGRIAGKLKDEFDKTGQGRLFRQLLLLDGADISTIHSFCKRIISEHFYLLGIDPTFGIMDADEQRLVKYEILEEIVEQVWEDDELASGLEQLLRRRDVGGSSFGFLGRVVEISDFLDGVISKDDWYERVLVAGEIFGTDLAKKQKQILLDKLQQCKSQLEYSVRLCRRFYPDGPWSGQIKGERLGVVEECIGLVNQEKWADCFERIDGFKAAKFKNKPKEMSKETAEFIRAPATKAMKDFKGFVNLAIINPRYAEVVGGASVLQRKMLVELVKRFDRRYEQVKRGLNCLDFSDLEHLALKLLSKPGSKERSDAGRKLCEKYKYIFIDEYQDINAVQQRILDLLSSGGNMFVVGDVKQSIYAFRQAEPRIFLERLEGASKEVESSGQALRVDLNENYRSRGGVLDFINNVFGRIMTPSVAWIEYDEGAMLREGADYKKLEEVFSKVGPVVEIHIAEKGSAKEVEDIEEDFDEYDAGEEAGDGGLGSVSVAQRQALLIGRRIKEMVGDKDGRAEFEIYDKQQDCYRDVDYKDIVILMRSPAKRAREYAEILRLMGIAVNSGVSFGYFETTEITDCVSLLKVLDNPQRDIELAAVLRSPFFKLSDTELAKIRVFGEAERKDGGRGSFYECLCKYSQDGVEKVLREKASEFLSQIEKWRTMARRGSLADLIWQIYRRRNYLSFVSALANGRGRRANLLKLHERAIQFEGFATSSQTVSLARFVEFIEKLLEQEQDWAIAEPENSAGNAVRIMSVHKSKGLEFGVVFLAGLETKFRKTEGKDNCLVDTEDGLGLGVINSESNARFSSLAHQVIAERKTASALAEEMRILYVAMTRARERLILCGAASGKQCREVLSRFQIGGEGGVMQDWQLRSGKCHLDWVLGGLAEEAVLHKAFETGLDEGLADKGLFALKLYDEEELNSLSEDLRFDKQNKLQKRDSKSKQEAKVLLSEIKASLEWKYSFADSVDCRAKFSVSELTHRSDEFATTDLKDVLTKRPEAVLAGGESKSGVDGRQIGTATHLVMQRLDLSKAIDEKVIEKAKAELVSDGMISESVAEYVEAGSIERFFQSQLGRMVLDGSNTVWREWPFTFAVLACEVVEDGRGRGCDETVIIQGVVDMVIKTPGGLVVIDFKTDSVSSDHAEVRGKEYARQVGLYAKAAECILGGEVVGRWLYFLGPGCAVEV